MCILRSNSLSLLTLTASGVMTMVTLRVLEQWPFQPGSERSGEKWRGNAAF